MPSPVPEQQRHRRLPRPRKQLRTDALVAKQQELIKLLQEKRTALISHTVTKGLDPDVAMKDSGVEWLGRFRRIGRYRDFEPWTSITTGGRDTVNRRHDGKYPFFVRSPVVERIDTWSFDGEAVLTAGDGTSAWPRCFTMQTEDSISISAYTSSAISIRSPEGSFFDTSAALLRFETLQGTAKSTVDSLRLPMLQNFHGCRPTPERTACDHCIPGPRDGQLSTLIIAKVGQTIKRLNEYRTALISAAVTGKIDVRHHGDHSGIR